ERYHLPYTGSFPRTIAGQLHRLRSRDPDNPALLVTEPDGTLRGYMLLDSGSHPERATEVGAESWPAALALLQYQAHLLDGRPDPPLELSWTVPSTAETLYLLLDTITLPRITPLPPYPQWYIVHSIQRHLPVAGEMARPADLRRLVEHL